MIINSIVSGVKKISQSKRMVGIFYLTNLLMGLLVMFPLRGMLSDFAGNSLATKNLVGGLNVDFLFEFLTNNSGGGQMLSGLVLLVACLSWLIVLFLTGGALSILMKGEPYDRASFWGNSAKYFGRMFRLWLFSLPVFLVLYLVQMIVPLVVRLAYGSDPYENIKFWGNFIRVGIGYIGIICYYLVFDYARMVVIKNDEKRMTVALFRGLRFTFTNIGRTFVLGLIFFVLGIASLYLYNVIAGRFSGESAFIVFFVILLQQLYILFKSLVKLSLYSSEVEVFTQLVPPEPEPVVELPILPEPEPPQTELGVTV